MTFPGCRQCPVKRQAEDAEESNLAGKCVCVGGGGVCELHVCLLVVYNKNINTWSSEKSILYFNSWKSTNIQTNKEKG